MSPLRGCQVTPVTPIVAVKVGRVEAANDSQSRHSTTPAHHNITQHLLTLPVSISEVSLIHLGLHAPNQIRINPGPCGLIVFKYFTSTNCS